MRNRRLLLLALGICIVSSGAYIALSLVARVREKQHEEQLAKAVVEIAAALDAYCSDPKFKGTYPENLRTLIEEGYLPAMPTNPWSSKSMIPAMSTEMQAGNYVYLRYTIELSYGPKRIFDDYYLFAISPRRLMLFEKAPALDHHGKFWIAFGCKAEELTERLKARLEGMDELVDLSIEK